MPSSEEQPESQGEEVALESSHTDKDDDKKKKQQSFFSPKFSFNLFKKDSDDDEESDEENDMKVMADRVFDQDDVDDEAQEKDGLDAAANPFDDANNEKEDEKKIDVWKAVSTIMKGGDGEESFNAVVELVATIISSQNGELSDTQSKLSASDFNKIIHRILDQFEGNFQDCPIDKLDPLAFLYFLEGEDARKNPSWKRRLHRFMPSIKLETVYGLHDALYLSQLAYVDTVEEIQAGLDNYIGAKYELVYSTTQGQPHQPAHYIVIKKGGKVPQAKEEKSSILSSFLKKTHVEVVMVVRGTKTLEDMFSDAMLEATDYRDGLSHDGLCRSGKYLVEKHTKLLMRILKTSKRDKIKLTVLGHSLGAGAAAIACIEFNDNDKIDATCIGFGCPALLDTKQSEKWKDKIITVISDSDCVCRMSGAAAANLLMDLGEFKYKEFAMHDVRAFVDTVSKKASYLLPEEKKEEAIEWFSDLLDKNAKPLSGLKRREVILFPPGKCVHFYRDGVGISACAASL
ncbi:MAG: hypothetical protein SGILL_004067 [Bacillariaceae sp.]